MFTYCKRGKSGGSTEAKTDQLAYSYHMSKLNTVKGFGTPYLCQSLNQPWVHNRGVPRDLLALEDAIKGRDRTYHPLCQGEQEELSFSTFRPPPVMPRGLPGTAPVPIIEVKGYGGGANGCDHLGQSCHDGCMCSSRCQCKGAWRGMNPTGRPQVPYLGMAPAPACRISF